MLIGISGILYGRGIYGLIIGRKLLMMLVLDALLMPRRPLCSAGIRWRSFGNVIVLKSSVLLRMVGLDLIVIALLGYILSVWI